MAQRELVYALTLINGRVQYVGKDILGSDDIPDLSAIYDTAGAAAAAIVTAEAYTDTAIITALATVVGSVSNSDGTVTVSGPVNAPVVSLALSHANTWTAIQTFSVGVKSTVTGGVVLTSANSSSATAWAQLQSLSFSTSTWGLGYNTGGGNEFVLGTAVITWSTAGKVGVGVLSTSPQSVLQVGPKSASFTATTFKQADSYIHLGDNEDSVGHVKVISFGYSSGTAHTYYPCFIGYEEKTNASWTTGDIIIGTRAADADSTAVVVTRVTAAGLLSTKPTNAVTNAVTNAMSVGHTTTGTAAAGFGTACLFVLDSSTTADQSAGLLSFEWVVATHASRTARGKLTAYDTAARECFRFEASGSAPMVGFLGSAAVVQQTSGADLTNNVTSGGTSDVIADYSDLIIYANDAAAIRNDLYQLARKLKQVNDALRAYGLLS